MVRSAQARGNDPATAARPLYGKDGCADQARAPGSAANGACSNADARLLQVGARPARRSSTVADEGTMLPHTACSTRLHAACRAPAPRNMPVTFRDGRVDRGRPRAHSLSRRCAPVPPDPRARGAARPGVRSARPPCRAARRANAAGPRRSSGFPASPLFARCDPARARRRCRDVARTGQAHRAAATIHRAPARSRVVTSCDNVISIVTVYFDSVRMSGSCPQRPLRKTCKKTREKQGAARDRHRDRGTRGGRCDRRLCYRQAGIRRDGTASVTRPRLAGRLAGRRFAAHPVRIPAESGCIGQNGPHRRRS